MEVDPEVFQFALDTIEAAKSPQQMGRLLFDLRELYHVENIIYHATRIEGSGHKHPLLFLTYDPQWVREYTTKDYFDIDPVVVSGRQANLPLDWNNVDRETPGVRKFFKKADSYGVGRQGYTIPIRPHPGDTVLFTFTSNSNDDDWQAFRSRRKAEFMFIGLHFHEKIVALTDIHRALPKLTPQQLRCMQYLVTGVKPKEIAHNLNLSLSTIRLHLNNARIKLTSANLNEAAAQAVQLGLVKL